MLYILEYYFQPQFTLRLLKNMTKDLGNGIFEKSFIKL